jgi:acetyl-CoA carboxylase biotin carboxyl carrier protein
MTDDPRPAPDAELIRSLWQEARDLIKRLEGTSVVRLAVQAGDYKIEIERGQATSVVAPSLAAAAPASAGEADGVGPAEAVDNRLPIVAPLVGTFFRASKPGAKPFVERGDVVEPGQTVAIVEAMKIMNTVAADRRGRVAEILANNGEWVEYQQVLMYLEPADA